MRRSSSVELRHRAFVPPLPEHSHAFRTPGVSPTAATVFGPPCHCLSALGPGLRLVAKKENGNKTGGKWARCGLKSVKESGHLGGLGAGLRGGRRRGQGACSHRPGRRLRRRNCSPSSSTDCRGSNRRSTGSAARRHLHVVTTRRKHEEMIAWNLGKTQPRFQSTDPWSESFAVLTDVAVVA